MLSDPDVFPLPHVIKQAMKSQINTPTVFKGQLRTWRQMPRTFDDFVEKFGSILLDFRVVSNSLEGIAWEGNASYVEATISQFISWQCGDNMRTNSNPFIEFNKDDYWAYSSYNYMNLIFPKDSEILQDINWSSFGFPEVTGKDSTFWLGSKGANTPCHADSYGCNLVAQILGRKKWILFPPEDGKFMYPTRIPYEESSVFSSVNVLDPNLSLHPHFKKTHPHVVTLESGDVLFVPKGWWHFVYSLDNITVSINAWIKSESDSGSRLTESVTKALITALISSYEPEDEVWLNPKEDLVPPDETLNYIVSALKELNESKNKTTIDNDSAVLKVMKSEKVSDVHSGQFSNNIFICKNITAVKPTPIFEIFHSGNEDSVEVSSSEHHQDITINKIVNCFVHPDVVKIICQLLKEM